MKMVHFTLDVVRLVRSKKHAYPEEKAIAVVCTDIAMLFCFTAQERVTMHNAGGAYIRCTPEDFVRFLVWRRDSGYSNQMETLNFKLVPLKGEADPPFPQLTAH